MEHVNADSWAALHFGLIFLITVTQMLIVYALADASIPVRGLGLYTVYFMAALLGWAAFSLQQLAEIPMVVDVPSVSAMLNGYLLFLAAGQRAEITRGRVALGLCCLGAILSVFFVTPTQIFTLQCAASAFFFTAAGIVCAQRAWRRRNLGDALSVAGPLAMLIGMGYVLFLWSSGASQARLQMLALGVQSCAFVLVAFGFLASVLVEYQQRLSHLATQDSLTRLLNRRGLEGALRVSMAQAARQQSNTSAILVDIDGFREINENFGHEFGDQVIRNLALVLQNSIRTSDVLARTGGQQFLIILPETNMDAARGLAERVRLAISEEPYDALNREISITASLGIAGVTGNIDLDKLEQEAQRALRLAKRGGNRIASVESKPIHLSTSKSNS